MIVMKSTILLLLFHILTIIIIIFVHDSTGFMIKPNVIIPFTTTLTTTSRYVPSSLLSTTSTTGSDTDQSVVDDATPTTTVNENNNEEIVDIVPKIGKLIFLLSEDCMERSSKFGTSSPIKELPSYYDVAKQLGEKTIYYTNNTIDYEIIILNTNTKTSFTFDKLYHAEIVIAFGIHTIKDIEYIQYIFNTRRTIKSKRIRYRLCHFAYDCTIDDNNDSNISIPLPLVGPYDPTRSLLFNLKSKLLPWTKQASGRRLYNQLNILFSRSTTDDFCYGIVLFLHLFSGTSIDWVKYQTDASWEKGILQNTKEFYNMITQCKDCIVPCIKDPKCRECLSKMSQLDPRDQVTSYRTIVSYESDLLTNISRCIFTKKNIFQCDAKIPTLPYVEPMTTFRNQPMTIEIGRSLLVGHLSNEDIAIQEGNTQLNVSWMVACGANVAYDQFPSQHQLFYPASRGLDMWYDPFFRTVTLDGRDVWCKRHYKVRPNKDIPGKFYLSTSDNGVTSNEIWTIVGAADDLSWMVIHYAGAAREVGLQYIGGLVCTPDGSLPYNNINELNKIWYCLQEYAKIQPWELTVVDNRIDTVHAMNAGVPPLGYYRNEIIKSRQKQITIQAP